MKKNNKTLILVREEDTLMKKVLEYNFKDSDIQVIPEMYTPFEREDLAKKINLNYENLILYGFYDQFNELISIISKKVRKQWIINYSISSLSLKYIFQSLVQLLEYQNRGLVDKIASLQYSLYIAFKERMQYIALDYQNDNKEEKKDRIGILNFDYNESSNFFNELTAVTMSKIKKARIMNAINSTIGFSKNFGVELEIEKDLEKIIYGNKINLDIEFSGISPIPFLMSMDAGIPCILGNTTLLQKSDLKNTLVLDSDDDVEEIKNKINYALDNTDTIINSYKKWRDTYSELSKKTIEEFMK